MRTLRTLPLALGLSAVLAPSAHAVVGGTPVPEGQRGYVAHITFEPGFLCTGTLVSPDTVVTAGHCSSITGAVAASPLPTRPEAITVTLGSVKAGDPAGEKPRVSRVIVPDDYRFTNSLEFNGDGSRGSADSNDVALLKLATPSKQTPVPLAAKGERSFWAAGAVAQIAGFGVTKPDGDPPPVMHETVVPIVTDEKAKATYPDSFEPVTQLGAGFPEGGRDTCQGDSGGPLIVPATNGALRLVGDTSYGRGCAERDTPGIYGRLADDKLRKFITDNDADAAAPEPTSSGSGTTTGTGTAPGSGSGPAPSGAVARNEGFGLAAATDRRTLTRALRGGLRLRINCSSRCATVTTLSVSRTTARRLGLRSRTVARQAGSAQNGRRTGQIRFSKAARQALRRTRRVGLTFRVVATSGEQRQVVTRRLTLRR